MPQKKNPDSLELIRGKCGRVIGCLNAMLVTMKGLPLTYNRDMQEDKEPLFEASDQLAGSLEMARDVCHTVTLNAERALRAAEESWVVATDLAEGLARSGVPFHQAHQLVGKLVLESVRLGKRPSDWNAVELQRFSPEFTAEIAGLLDPRRGMHSRALPGGTAPAAVDKALSEAKQLLGQMDA
jgi:argininosuccinate lyase